MNLLLFLSFFAFCGEFTINNYITKNIVIVTFYNSALIIVKFTELCDAMSCHYRIMGKQGNHAVGMDIRLLMAPGYVGSGLSGAYGH